MARFVIPLNSNWTFRQADDESAKFLPVAQFPTNVHLDLAANDLIPDPYPSKNENDVQWVGEKAWIYKTSFEPPSLPSSKDARVVIAFEGLDTYATVRLNDHEILRTENMFVPERVDVTKLLARGSKNELIISFESAFLEGKKIQEKHPNHHWGCWNGDPSRLAVRKAQYHYGWDWGPTLLTCGPWRPINLEVYSSRISDLYFETDIDSSLQSAQIVAHVDMEGSASTVALKILQEGRTVCSETVQVSDGKASATFVTHDPELWYPAGYGKQPLYHLEASLLDHDVVLDFQSKSFGLRRARLVQHRLDGQPGTSFFFEVNNVPIFAGGSDWIPADNFIPRIEKQRYRDWVKLAVEGNQKMIRVWGGGIFEEQAFYDACDEFGVLVWQDFLFGCGNYPAYPEFLHSVKREAEANVKLLRHHPCIVIYAGNNEDYQYQESENLDYDPNDHDPQSWLKSSFPARYIYEKLLVDVTRELVPNTYYHFGSPWGGKDTTDPTVGDIHQWNVWHGTQERYQDFDKLGGRFVSEFGMEAFPDIRTIDSFLPSNSGERYSQSSIMDFHNKAAGHERRLALYLVENIQYKFDPLEQYIYCTQLIQAECLSSAYRLWKRQWKGPGKEYCGGVLVWQLNDCWPVTSWAIVDYYLRPKLAYYAVKRELAPITIGMKRTVHQLPADKYTRVYIKTVHNIELWATNLTLESKNVDVHIRVFDVESGDETWSGTIKSNCVLLSNRSTEIAEFEIPIRDVETRTVVAAYLLENGKQIARYINWPEPLKYLHFQKPQQLTARLSMDGSEVSVTAEVPVKGVALESHVEGVKFTDNGIDIVPGETVTISVQGLKPGEDDKFGVRYLGM